ncbi:MFS transporter [Longirhabdus pacifica]|uniref:MFS transporter n=1 Tax=Longirhabdus pacifica TaxID=2305227 RepID=UPI001008E9A2|nr:MFS transporter [Longirhabdus pacifica]
MNHTKTMRRAQANVYILYGYQFFHSFILAYVIERLFWESRGISIQEVVWIQLIYGFIVLVAELPSGWFADRFARKNAIIIDAICTLTELFILIFAQHFWHFAFAVALAAVGEAFQSGAQHALLYDSCKAAGGNHHFEKTLGRMQAVKYASSMISALLGAIIATTYAYVTTYWISLISLVIALLLAICLREIKRDEAIQRNPFTWEMWKNIFTFLLTKKHIRYMLVMGIFSGSIFTYLDEFWQLYLDAIHFPVSFYGIVSVLCAIAVIIGSIISYSIRVKLGLHASIVWMLFISTLCVSLLVIIPFWYVITALTLLYLTFAVIKPMFYSYLHEHALDAYRASIESAFSIMQHIAIIIIGIPFGYLSSHCSIFIGFAYLASVLIVFTSMSFLNRNIKLET